MANIYGTAGADNNLQGTSLNDKIYGYGGDDILDGGDGNDALYGNEGEDLLLGGAGNDQLTGGEGADRMVGGTGNDTYFVENRGDVVVEAASEGTDTVVFMGFSDGGTQSYRISSNIEVLRLQGNGVDLDGVGNENNNSILGDGGNNSIGGGGGNDNLYGYGGNDIIDGGSGDDIMDGGDGIDIVSYKSATSGVTVDLSKTLKQDTGGAGIDALSNFENLEGSAWDDFLTGNGSANKIVGLGGNDKIRGGAGDDDLTGGNGADTFIFDNAATNGTDRIRGFESGVDKLDVSGVGAVSGSTFSIVDNSLIYDVDGAGAGVGIVLAHFDPSHIPTMADLILV